MAIQNRPARAEDLPACVDLFLESVADMLQRHNLAPGPPREASSIRAFYEHALTTGIFHVAEVNHQIGALACAIVRDDIWFLSGFWARPSIQQQHIGMSLLKSVRQAGKEAGATHFFVWSSIDLPAMAAYFKIGMLPGCQILIFEGTPSLPAGSLVDRTVQPLSKSVAMDLDRRILGTSREVDHEYLVRTGYKGREVMRGDEPVGYYYLDRGSIGPAAWSEPREAESLLTLAAREASTSGQGITLRVPGMNHAALNFALQSGLRLTSFNHLLMSAPFGILEQYIPSGPAIF